MRSVGAFFGVFIGRALHLGQGRAYICCCPRGIRAMFRTRFLILRVCLPHAVALVALLAAAVSPWTTSALAQAPRVVPQSAADARLSYAPIVARVAPAVVNVY